MALIMVAFLFVPTWQNQNKDMKTKDGKASDAKVTLTPFYLTLNGTEKYEERSKDNIIKEQKILNETKITIYIAILAIVVAVVGAFSIFQYRTRTLQVKLGAFNSLLLCLIVVCISINIMQGNKLLDNPADGDFQGFFIPIIGILLNMMANHFIRRDEKLVKSADRIR